MRRHRQNKLPWLTFVLLLVLTIATGYVHYRQQIFEVLAAGTEWVLVSCGFQPADELERSETLPSDQLRKLFYAARMFNSPPPQALSEEDARADKLYPGLGFGLVHTFSLKPVSVVVGGWLFNIPCTYFADARDCQKSGAMVARLRVSADDMGAMNEKNIEAFLAASSPDIMTITLAGLNSRAPQWWQQIAVPQGYEAFAPAGFTGGAGGLICTESPVGHNVMPHCLLRFMHGRDVFVEVKFAALRRDNWAAIERQAGALIRGFQVKR